MQKFKPRHLLLSAGYLVCMLGLASFNRQDVFFLLLATILSVCLLSRIAKNSEASPFLVFMLFVIARAVFFLFDPQLSDDVFRFHWDALVQQEGLSPYQFLPSELLDLKTSQNCLYFELNSKDYYSVYPPLLQYLFYGLKSIFPQHFYFGLKVVILGVELLLYLLIYAINERSSIFKVSHLYMLMLFPVLILEGIGNFHLEVLMIPFFLLAYVMYQTKRELVSAIVFAIAISVKVTIAPMFLLFVGKGIKEDLKFLSILIIAMAMFNLELITYWSEFSTSLNLYFSSFEFNNLVYFIIREIWQPIVGYNPILHYGFIYKWGLFMLAISFYGLCVIKQKKAVVLLHVFFGVYFLFNPVIHPWYLLVPLSLNLIYRVRFWEIWSVIALLSYAFYSNGEQLGWWIYIEYSVLFIVGLYYWFGKKYSIAAT